MEHLSSGASHVVGHDSGNSGILAESLVRWAEMGPDVGRIIGLTLFGPRRARDGGLTNRSGVVPGEP